MSPWEGCKASYKIIKATGKEEDIDMSTAIEEESDVPGIYRPIFYRLSIRSDEDRDPNLEVGDIIDYTVRFHD
jgi:hypothetical protein